MSMDPLSGLAKFLLIRKAEGCRNIESLCVSLISSLAKDIYYLNCSQFPGTACSHICYMHVSP